MQEISLYTLNKKIDEIQNIIDKPTDKLDVYNFINVESLEDRNNESTLLNTYIIPAEIKLSYKYNSDGSAKDYDENNSIVAISENKISYDTIYIKQGMCDYGDIYSQGVEISPSGIRGIVEGDEHSIPNILGFGTIAGEYLKGNGEEITNINAKTLNVYNFDPISNTDFLMGNIVAYYQEQYVRLTPTTSESNYGVAVSYADNADTVDGKHASDLQNYNNLTNKPTSMKNPNALTISFNGTLQCSYDGSSTKSINITPSNINAAKVKHTHYQEDIQGLPISFSILYSLNDYLNTPSCNYYLNEIYKYTTVGLIKTKDGYIVDIYCIDNQDGEKLPDCDISIYTIHYLFIKDNMLYYKNVDVKKKHPLYSGTDEWIVNNTSSKEFDLSTKLQHTHDYNSLINKPTSMKNPYSLTIQTNGTSQGSYDGSTSKTINITPTNIGAAKSSYSDSIYDNDKHMQVYRTYSINEDGLNYDWQQEYADENTGDRNIGKVNITKYNIVLRHERDYEDSSYCYRDLTISNDKMVISESIGDSYGESSIEQSTTISGNTIDLHCNDNNNEDVHDYNYYVSISKSGIKMKETYTGMNLHPDDNFINIGSGNIDVSGTITAPCFNGGVRTLNVYQYNTTTAKDECVGGIVAYRQTNYIKLQSNINEGMPVSVAYSDEAKFAKQLHHSLTFEMGISSLSYTFDGNDNKIIPINCTTVGAAANRVEINSVDNPGCAGFYSMYTVNNGPDGSSNKYFAGIVAFSSSHKYCLAISPYTKTMSLRIFDTSNNVVIQDWKQIAYADVATTTKDGLMSAADKVKLNNLSSSSGGTDTKNTTGSSNSTNKLFLVGATTQNSTGVQTYSNSSVYTMNGTMYATTFNEDGTTLANKYLGKTATATAATKLATSRKIGNASFDGTSNITLGDIGIITSSIEPTNMTTGTICLVTE